MTQLKDKEVTCKKPHVCAWCGQSIQQGQRANYRVAIWEGEFMDEYMHPECYQALCASDDVSEGFEAHAQLRGKTYEESHP